MQQVNSPRAIAQSTRRMRPIAMIPRLLLLLSLASLIDLSSASPVSAADEKTQRDVSAAQHQAPNTPEPNASKQTNDQQEAFRKNAKKRNPRQNAKSKSKKTRRSSFPRLYFERSNDSTDRVRIHDGTGGIMIQGAALATHLGVAYDIDPNALVYEIEFDHSRRFQALIRPKDRRVETAREMLREVLESRFDLKLRRERRRTQVMVLKRRGRKKQIHPVTPNGQPPRFEAKKGELRATQAPISMLVDFLGKGTKIPILDESGLDGRYDYFLEWDSGSGAYALIQALEDLGLNIAPATRMIDIGVVESRLNATTTPDDTAPTRATPDE
jgi:uncharacterized protein (TIGR03435 family)